MIDIAALAYIDPGSGTVLLQILLSGLFAGVLLFRNTVLSLFGLRSRREKHGVRDEEVPPAPGVDSTASSSGEERRHDHLQATR